MIPAHWTEDDLSINGASLHYYRTGDGSKFPLVLVHGFSDNGRCWIQTAVDLEDDYDIIMPDARGHGRSERIRPGEHVDMAADLAGIIQALDLQNPIIGGHSMGAMVTFQLAVQYPEIPRALILEDPPWFPPEFNQAMSQLKEHPMAPWVATIQRQTLDELIAETRAEHPTWPEWAINTWCPAKKDLDHNILSIMHTQGIDWSENAAQLACPTLIFTADVEQGGLVTPAVAAQLQELNPLITVRHIQGTGHHIRFADYAAFTNQVRAFLQEIE